jgi:hypothetical protein
MIMAVFGWNVFRMIKIKTEQFLGGEVLKKGRYTEGSLFYFQKIKMPNSINRVRHFDFINAKGYLPYVRFSFFLRDLNILPP